MSIIPGHSFTHDQEFISLRPSVVSQICGGHTCTEAAAILVKSEVLRILQKEHTHTISPTLKSATLESSSPSSSPTPGHNNDNE